MLNIEMRKIFLFLITLLPVMAMAQTEEAFMINGNIGQLNTPAKAYLIYKLGANQVIDSAGIIGGKFTLGGKILNPTKIIYQRELYIYQD